MINKINKILTIVLSAILVFFGMWGICVGKANTYNLINSNIFEQISLSQKTENRTISGNDSIDLDFVAKYNNLGGIQFLFDSVGDKSTILKFCIKEENEDNWNCQQSFDLSEYDTKNYYVFGISPIVDSRDKKYHIKISIDDKTSDSLATLNTDSKRYYPIYNYPLTVLKNNKNFISTFILQKLQNYLGIINFEDIVFLLVWSTLSLFLAKSFVKFVGKINLRTIHKSISKWIKDNVGLLILLVIYVISHIPFLTYSQYWDASFYFNYIVGVAEKLMDFVHFANNFNILGHPSMGYASLISISQVISNNNNVYLLNIENVILAIFAIAAFYKVFLFFFEDRKTEALLLTTVFAFNPLFYATSISLNLDFPVLVFFVLMLNSQLHKKYISFSFWSILMVFSKETGLLIYLTYIGAYFLLITLKKIFIKNNKFDMTKILYLLFPVILFVLYLSSNNWHLWSNQGSTIVTESSSFKWNDNGNFTFGINSANIITRTTQMFVMNFSWIISLLIISAFIKSQILGKSIFDKLSLYKKDYLRVLAITLFGFVIFNYVYIVMPFSRYTVFSIFPFTIFGYLAINYLFPKKKLVRVVILTMTSVLLCIQTFRDIDPSVKTLYGKRTMGNNISSPFYGMADGLVYNAQFAYFDSLANLIIKETKGAYLVRDNANVYFFKDMISSGVRVDDIGTIKNKNYSNIIFVHFPWFSNVDDDLVKLRKYYNVSYIKSLEVAGYSAELYRLE